MPTVDIARFDDLEESAVLAFPVNQRLARAQAAPHDLGYEQTAAADFADKPLANDVAQRLGQPFAHLFLFVFNEHAENALHSLAGIDRVQSGENQMTGFGGSQGNFHRFTIPNLTD